MAMSSAISGSSSSDGDANTALAELDQGLRSGRLGEQSEAIVKFPRLFAKYPFPILINSALLKLADIFRQSSNFIRLCVLRVVQRCERHLDKITNIDDFLRRIFAVIHSNDPVARALTLRTLGAIAAVVPERRQIHHTIRNALDSHDTVELQAAIFAAGRFAAQSKVFAVNMCSKISEMIQGYATPLRIKLDLIPILQHMHHDAHTAAIVRKTCIEILPSYPSQEFVVVTLHTLSLLSAHTLVDIPEQVELLIKHLNDDPRKGVQKCVLQDLKFLASTKHAHVWDESNVGSVLQFASQCPESDKMLLIGILSVLCDLVRHTSAHKLSLQEAGATAINLCRTYCYSSSLPVAAKTIHLMTLMATHGLAKTNQTSDASVDLVAESVMAIESLFLLLNGEEHQQQHVDVTLKQCLQCVVLLCKVQPDYCDQFVELVGSVLSKANSEAKWSLLLPLCEVLSALGDMKQGVLSSLRPTVCLVLSKLQPNSKHRCRIVSLLATLLFQMHRGCAWDEESLEAIQGVMAAVDLWTCYRMARTATRYGHFSLAAQMFQRALEGVSSEHFYFWLKGLIHLSNGEEQLNDEGNSDLTDRLNRGMNHLLLAQSDIRAATTQTQAHEFQSRYLKCRFEMVQVLGQLVDSCHSLRTSPPPAIASSQAKVSHDDLQRCGRITPLLRHSVKEFCRIGTLFEDLYETSFDADPGTLAQLHILQQLHISIGQWIESVCLKSSLHGSMYDTQVLHFSPRLDKQASEYSIVIQNLITTGQAIAKCFEELLLLPPSTGASAPITHVQTSCLLNVVRILSSAPIGLPRQFYQSLQETNINLAVSPQPKTSNEPIAAPCSQHLAVKVEGVITANSKGRQLRRKVQSVKLSLNSSLVQAKSTAQPPNDGTAMSCAKLPNGNQTMEQGVMPHNDFFSAQFLLPFSVAGTYLVTIETKLVDNEGRTWRTTLVKSALSVKAFDDNHNRSQGSMAAVGRGQSRPT